MRPAPTRGRRTRPRQPPEALLDCTAAASHRHDGSTRPVPRTRKNQRPEGAGSNVRLLVVLTSILSNTTPAPLDRAIAAYRNLILPELPPPLSRQPPPRRIAYLTPRQLDQLADAYRHGASVYELADRFGVNRRTVSKRLKSMGIALSSGRLYAADTARILELHRAGRVPSQVAIEIGRPELLVWRVLKAARMTAQ